MARPREDKSLALLDALAQKVAQGQQPTMRELAYGALLSLRDARMILNGLVRGGHVVIIGFRRVHYRNRPVAEYGLPGADKGVTIEGPRALADALSCWR